MIFWAILMTLWSAFLCAVVQLENHTPMQYVSTLSMEQRRWRCGTNTPRRDALASPTPTNQRELIPASRK